MTAHDHPQKAHFSGVFHRASETYDTVGVDFFAPLATALVGRASLQPGMHVLDLGTGRGAALHAAAAAVGESGEVHGVDLAAGMVERTSLDVAGLAHVSVSLGDADHPPGREGGWDAVLASFVLFFLPDPVGAASRIRAVLRPGGAFLISTFGAPDERWKVVEAAVRPYWPPTTEPSHPSALASFATVDSTEDLLRQAGYVDISTEVVAHENVYADVDQWLAWTWSAGARVIWERVPEADRDAAQASAAEAVAGLAGEDGLLRERFSVRLTRAVAP